MAARESDWADERKKLKDELRSAEERVEFAEARQTNSDAEDLASLLQDEGISVQCINIENVSDYDRNKQLITALIKKHDGIFFSGRKISLASFLQQHDINVVSPV